jgi:hypothetical protein
MPTAPAIPVSSARSRVTDTIQVIDAQAIDVAFAGDRCAIHVHTAQGTRTVLLSFHEFMEKCRGTHDCNCKRFPSPSDIKKDRGSIEPPSIVIAAAEAKPALEKLAASMHASIALEKKVNRIVRREEQFRTAFKRYIADPALELGALAQELHARPSNLRAMFDAFGREPGAPALKPNGKI